MKQLDHLKRLAPWICLGGAALVAAPPAFANAPWLGPDAVDPATRPQFAPDRILVQLDSASAQAARAEIAIGNRTTSLPSIDALLSQVSATGVTVTHIPARNVSLAQSLGLDRWFTVEVPEGTNILEWTRRFEADPNVEQAGPDFIAYPAAVPNDTRYSLQWGHNNTAQMLDYCWGCGGHDSGSPVGTVGFDADAQLAWDGAQGYGSASVVIAIIDSGVDVDHPDLRLVTGYDYGDNDTNPDDNSAQPGHGTACAGVAAARANNALGVAGIAGGCSVMPLKVANSAGSMFFSSIQNALIHCGDNGVDVASMSLGAAISSDGPTDSAISYAYNAGVTILAATGNENASTISYPAINSLVIGVGAASPCGERKRSSSSSSEVNPGVNTDPNGYTCDGERWWGSNYGTNSQDAAGAVDLIAPTILPTTDIGGSGGYNSGDYDNWFNGTSCATPYAAGVAALVVSANPTFTPAQVRNALVTTCTDVTSVESGSGWDRYSGYGMINAAGAVGSSGGGGGNQEYSTLPYSTGFEGGLDVYWDTQSSASVGRIQTTSANTPHSGSSHLTMDCSTSGTYSQNEAWLHLDLSGESNVDLSFWWKEFGDETHSQDGVYFSNNGGASFVKVQDLNGASYTNNTWVQFNLDLDALASANGLSLSDQFVIKFQQYDNYPIATDGFAFDDISVTGGVANTVTLTAPNGGETFTSGTSTNVTWTSTGSIANVALDYSTNAGGSWTSIVASTTNDGSYSWTVPATATTQGRVRVSDASNSGVNDASNANFTIEVPSGGGYASLPYTTGFEGGLDSYWDTQSSNSFGRIQTTSANTPHSGTSHLTMDVTTNGNYAQNEAWLHLDLSGQSNVDLSFWWKDFGDETHTQDGIYFSSNGGTSFVKVYNLNGASYSNNTWRQFTIDVDALASSNGLSLTGTFVVKFQQYDNYAIATDGFAFDDIAVTSSGGGGGGGGITSETEPNGDSTTANGPISTGTAVSGTISSSADDDWFYFDVTSAGTVNISLAIGSSADLDWYLYNSSLTEVARGYTVNNPETGSYNAAAGRYYLRIDGYQGATSSYSVTVTGGLQLFALATRLDLPKAVELHTGAPNPFAQSTTMRFDLPKTTRVNIAIFDVSGRLVRTLVDREVDGGYHSIDWDGRDDLGKPVANGVYFTILQTPDRSSRTKTIRMQ
ncbi:MAG: S8 family serine peptidase [Candidatus Eisenbacteria bacterium]|uniref:S8 family serine peptidase n=1 Tax=Eiseniibacteriota bacterium TaxID=2212470 RepID=A0A956SEJ3_UNCEI|nr:S8 family serine peptidase [Candidatus Eisenbacteria bacterium]MCB9466514.1 S8 family serine peptidase [Candidatus Eisenbacteria bacterium]